MLRPGNAGEFRGTHYRARWWDWTGSGWMMSENPILLLDSTLADDVVAGGEPRCRFWRDAFHSISFDWVPTDGGVDDKHGFYECSPRFRAKLTASRMTPEGRKHSNEAGGPARRTRAIASESPDVSVPNAGQWMKFPDKFEVSLYDGEIVYEFTPVWQDVPKWNYKFDWSTSPMSIVQTSMHERPLHPLGKDIVGTGQLQADLAFHSPWESEPIDSSSWPHSWYQPGPLENGRGLGMPYYALATAIRDKFGNRAEISYTPLVEYPDVSENTNVVQNTNQKGQIREIKLKTADGNTQWTLLYTYRLIPTDSAAWRVPGFSSWDELTPTQKRCWGDSVVDTIYVYAGDVDTKSVTLVRSPEFASVQLPLDEADVYLNQNGDMIDKYEADGLPDTIYWPGAESLPSASDRSALQNWKYRCRYYYQIGNNHAETGPTTSKVDAPAQLTRSRVERRTTEPVATSEVTERNKVFFYQPGSMTRFSPWLAAVFDDDGVHRAVAAMKADSIAQSFVKDDNHDAELRSFTRLGWENRAWQSAAFASTETLSKIREAAGIWFQNAAQGSETSGAPNGQFGQIETSRLLTGPDSSILPAQEWCTDSCRGTVGALTFTDEGGQRRYFRITRFAAIPGTESLAIHTDWPSGVYSMPMRSAFHTPYYWQNYALGNRYGYPPFPLSWSDGDAGSMDGDQSAAPTPYTDARWVAIIDEFPTYSDLRDSTHTPITGGAGTFSSFFRNSTRRQIIGINPQGNVLWQKNYYLRGDRFTESGDMGLTETWVYKTGEEILHDVGKSSEVIAAASATFKKERFLVAKKTAGYAAAAIEAQGTGPSVVPTSKGLIHVLTYGDVVDDPVVAISPDAAGFAWGERIKVIATGIRNGDLQPGTSEESTVYYRSRTFYDPADPTLVTGISQLTVPVTSPPGVASEEGAILSRIVTTKEKDLESGYYTKISTKAVSPPHVLRPDDPATKYYDVSFDIAGPLGLTVWSVSATLPSPDSLEYSPSDPNVRVMLTYFTYDPLGRPSRIWSDVDKAESLGPGETIPAEDVELLPAGLNRAGGGTPAQKLCTSYIYEEDVVRETHFPNGRVFARRKFVIPDTENLNNGKPITRIFRLNDLELVGDSGSTYKTKTLCAIEDYGEFDLEYQEMVSFRTPSGTGAIPFGNSIYKPQSFLLRTRLAWIDNEIDLDSSEAYENFTPQPPTVLTYDFAGRITAAKNTDLDWNGDTAAIAEVTDVGDRIRVKEMDGTSKMSIRDARGYLVRTYTGTNAFTWDDNVWHAPTRGGSDMILRERVEFGRDYTNATLPARKWSYLNTPSRGWDAANLAPFGPAPEDDPEGELTETKYDWRMRPVRVDVFGPMGQDWQYRSSQMPDPGSEPGPSRPRLSTRLTYLDHADRPIIEASFGDSSLVEITSAIDPCLFAPDAPRLASEGAINALIADILGAKATSLVRTTFYSGGTVKERRTYRAQSIAPGAGYSGASDYVVERFGYGPGGQEVFAARPSSPIQITTLDNAGRPVSERSILPRMAGGVPDYEFELSRTEYGYDADGNTILTARWERIMPSGGSSSPSPTGDAALSTDNAVCHLAENWYDPSKRLIATADYGTGSTTAGSSGTFATPSNAPTLEARLGARLQSPTERPELEVPGVDGAPAWLVHRSGVDPFVSLTVHCYDRQGNKVGTATQRNFASTEQGVEYVFAQMEYDAKGRLFVQTDDATGIKRRTKYGYWLGRAVSICSPTQDDSSGGENTTWQTQGAIYGAEIVAEAPHESDGLPSIEWISRSNALVGAMLSTNPGTTINNGSMTDTSMGQDPTPGPSGLFPDVIAGLNQFRYDRPEFAYRYYADGQIAERVDRRRLAMRYFYDDHRRLREVEVWHYPKDAAAPADYPTGGNCAKNIYPIAAALRGYPAFLNPFPTLGAGFKPVNRIGFISYEYDGRGNTVRITARESRDASEIITDTKYVYDERGNLTGEYQAHGTAWNEEGVPFIQYSRSYSSANATTAGAERLVSMTYPAFESGVNTVGGSRTINFGYGAAGSADALTGRIASISMGTMNIAGFGYTGTGRRTSMALGGTASSPGLWTNFGGSSPPANALPGLDSFGRVRDLHYATASTSAPTLWRGEYEYDALGNRLFEKLTQRPSAAANWGGGTTGVTQAAQSGANTRSRRFGYDRLERLTASLSGTLDSAGEIAPGSGAYPTIRSERWALDKLGNWAGSGTIPAPLIDPCSWDEQPVIPPIGVPGGPGSPPIPPPPESNGGPVGSVAYFFQAGHSVVLDEDSETASRLVWDAHIVGSGVEHPAEALQTLSSVLPNAIHQVHSLGGGAFAQQVHRTDYCGNLVLDEKYYYQYDAWNRLVSVHEKGTLTYYSFDEWGVPRRLEGQDATPQAVYPTTCQWPALGKLVKHFTYDGVGRLARTSTPLEAPEGWTFQDGSGNAVTAFTRSERFIYDGVRRIQEIVTDPVMTDGEGNRVATMSAESEQRGGGGSGQGGELPAMNVFLRAQYVWGPGDNGVDELLCQIEPYSAAETHAPNGPQGKPWFILTDAQGDVVSIASVGMGLGGGSPIASVASQWTYSPYGEVLTYDQIAAHPEVVFGHKSLAIDRLDAPALTWENESEPGAGDGALFETRRLEPGARLLAYARNRTLDIQRGRWLQTDPNASGLSLLGDPAMHGRCIARDMTLALETRLTDGIHLANALRGNPITHRDNFGLFGLIDSLITGGGMAMDAADAMQDAMNGVTLRLRFGAFMDQVVAQSLAEVDWATNWEYADEWNPRGGSTGGSTSFSVGESDSPAFFASANVGPGNAGPRDYAGRQHGKAWHDMWCKAYTDFYSSKYGSSNVKFNRVLSGAGPRVLPDVAAFDPKTKTYTFVEVMSKGGGSDYVTSRKAQLAAKTGVAVGEVSLIVHTPTTVNKSMSAIGGGAPRLRRLR
ncbi:MAG: hypothetical protein KF805_07810 [Phycisphaeraceae bacterium]|nr:hypothetical protein [Phycisphaeraceae bacterium]